jgi:hypothetical protein
VKFFERCGYSGVLSYLIIYLSFSRSSRIPTAKSAIVLHASFKSDEVHSWNTVTVQIRMTMHIKLSIAKPLTPCYPLLPILKDMSRCSIHSTCSSWHTYPNSFSPLHMLFSPRHIVTLISILHSILPLSTYVYIRDLSLPLKIRARGEKSDTLVHDRLADPQVVVDPLLDARGFGKLVGLDAGTVSD